MNDRVTIRVSAEIIAALDRLIVAGTIPARSRQDAFRQIVEEWLATNGHIAGRQAAEVLRPSRATTRTS